MPTTRALSRLFQAIAGKDWTRAESVAAEICKAEDHLGHHTAARWLRGSLGANGFAAAGHHRGVANGSSIHPNGMTLHPAVSRLETSTSLAEVVLPPAVREELEQVLLEWTRRERLSSRAIRRRSTLLFHGPPGCGKSMTAAALGNETSLPVYLVRFNALIGAYLGQTAINLRQIFYFAETTPCVLLIDELDALGKRRGSAQDVGELDRVVIALMQELEHSAPQGFVIGATNLPGHLDEALWRRFDCALSFPSPTKARLVAYARDRATARKVDLSPRVLGRVKSLRNFADVARLVEDAARRQVLEGV